MLSSLTKYERSLLSFVWVLIGVLFMHAFLAIFFFGFYQKNPITYELPLPISPSVVHAGQPIYSLTTRCAKSDYTVTATRALVDGIIYAIPQVVTEVPKGCSAINRLLLVIPDELPNGTYSVNTTIEVPIKWLYFRRIDKIKLESETFQIVDK